MKFWQVKPEIRILGVDDGPFGPAHRGPVPLVGVVTRGGRWIDGVMRTYVEKDGTDATERLCEMIAGSRHRGQLRVVMTDGITFAGFNVLDARELYRRTGLPVIVISRERPNMRDIRKAISHISGWRSRWKVMRGLGRLHPVEVKGKWIYMQIVGIEREDAEKVVRLSSTRSVAPEPLRIAHLIATAMVRGESYGRV
ncbi:MAG: DUF99 family protein [Candidatus Hadarchaeales archaeon]